MASLFVTRSGKRENVGSTPPHCRIECIQTVRAHDDSGRKFCIGDAVDAADEGVHAGTVFVVHLRGFARLRQRIGLIDQHDDRAAQPSRTVFQLGRLSNGMIESGRKQLRHFTDTPLSARRQAERERVMSIFFLARDGIADRLSEFGFARADIACKHDQRRAAQDGIEQASASDDVALPTLRVLPGLTSSQGSWQAAFLVIETDQPRQPILRLEIRIGDAAFKQPSGR